MENVNQSTASSIRETRIQKLTDLIDMGVNPYPYTFDKTANAKTLQEKYKDLENGVETEDVYSVAGRVMAIRNTGMFIDLMDSTGKIQIFSHKQNLSEDITGEVEVLVKYDGYIARQEQQVESTEKLEKYKIPVDIDYSQIKHISTETKEKLEKIRPTNLAQASRIGGVKPADISVLMVMLKG